MGKKVGAGIAGIALILIILFGLEWLGIGWTGYFGPKKQAVRRKVFEESKSYSHGRIQDLAKYYKEYNMAKSQDEKDTIASVIRFRFAEFDADKISSAKLYRFLVNIRGY